MLIIFLLVKIMSDCIIFILADECRVIWRNTCLAARTYRICA